MGSVSARRLSTRWGNSPPKRSTRSRRRPAPGKWSAAHHIDPSADKLIEELVTAEGLVSSNTPSMATSARAK